MRDPQTRVATRRDKAWDRAGKLELRLVMRIRTILEWLFLFAILLSESGWERNKVLKHFNLKKTDEEEGQRK